MDDGLVEVSLSGTHIRKLRERGLSVVEKVPTCSGLSALVEPWLRDLLSVGLQVDGPLLDALLRVRDDEELREACLALVRMAAEENCGKAVALGRFLGVPLPAWMEAGAVFKEHKWSGHGAPAREVLKAPKKEPGEAQGWPF